MSEFHHSLWAPWRMDYLRSGAADATPPVCFLCHYAAHPSNDADQLVLWRTASSLVLLNRYPYSNGHLLVAPTAHHGALEQLSEPVLCELTTRVRDATRVLGATVEAQGYNIGINLGRCAGAGLPDHLHWHIVPRWSGDTNFVTVVGGVRVIPQTLEDFRERFLERAAALGLPH